MFGRDELLRQSQEIERDKENLHVRRVCAVNRPYDVPTLNDCCQALIHNEIAEITHKIEALDAIRSKLEQDLLRLQEDELELDDECKFHAHDIMYLLSSAIVEGVKERLEIEESKARAINGSAGAQQPSGVPPSSRRRKGTTLTRSSGLILTISVQGLRSYLRNMTSSHTELHSW